MAPKPRPDHDGTHRRQFDINKRKILATQEICGICGKPVDKKLKYPNKWAPTIDHIKPIARGGDPSALSNLQLAHWWCNRQKSDKLMMQGKSGQGNYEDCGNRDLPQPMDWTQYHGG